MKDKETVAKIRAGIDTQTINKTNYEATMRKINTLIGE